MANGSGAWPLAAYGHSPQHRHGRGALGRQATVKFSLCCLARWRGNAKRHGMRVYALLEHDHMQAAVRANTGHSLLQPPTPAATTANDHASVTVQPPVRERAALCGSSARNLYAVRRKQASATRHAAVQSSAEFRRRISFSTSCFGIESTGVRVHAVDLRGVCGFGGMIAGGPAGGQTGGAWPQRCAPPPRTWAGGW